MNPSRPAPLSVLLLCLSVATAVVAEEPIWNITAILDKAGAYSMLIQLLNTTQQGIQLNNHLNQSNDLTFLAPTDNAFNKLPKGFLNSLTHDQQIKLVHFHCLPKFIVWDDFKTISNPQNTIASGDHGVYTLNFTWLAIQQVNVSTGSVEATFSNAVNTTKPLALYQLDTLLLPPDRFGANAGPPPSAAPPSAAATPQANVSSPSSPSPPNSNVAAPTATAILGRWSFKGMLFVVVGLTCGALIV